MSHSASSRVASYRASPWARRSRGVSVTSRPAIVVRPGRLAGEASTRGPIGISSPVAASLIITGHPWVYSENNHYSSDSEPFAKPLALSRSRSPCALCGRPLRPSQLNAFGRIWNAHASVFTNFYDQNSQPIPAPWGSHLCSASTNPASILVRIVLKGHHSEN